MAAEREARVSLARVGDALEVRCAARLFGDAGPPGPPGPTDRLWEHEVIEVFVAGEGTAYLEIELGPWGNHLVLQLADERKVARSMLPIDYVATVSSGPRGRRWSGRARVPWALLPPGPLRVNAYAIQPGPEGRVFLAAFPTNTPQPDFHRPESFRSTEISPRRSVRGVAIRPPRA